jgi:hypothetical protein
MAHPAGESNGGALRLDFDRRIMLQFCGSVVTSDAGLLPYRELDDVLGLTVIAGNSLADARTGKNVLVFVRSGDGSRDVAAADQKSMAFWRRFDAARWRSTTARSRVGARSHKVTVVKECAIVLTHVPASEIKPRSLRRASLVFGVERFNYAPRGTY